MARGKHTRTNGRLRKAVTVSAMSLVLPVVGAGSAFADGSTAPGQNADSGASPQAEDTAASGQDAQPDEGDDQHPSGKDKTVEAGGSGEQGDATGDPDGDANGGVDQPGGGGGVDTGDQDGNNGCGNDDDFEDDNNGNCGGPDEDVTPVDETPVEQTPVEQTPVEQTPVEQTPVEQTPVEQTPVQGTAVLDRVLTAPVRTGTPAATGAVLSFVATRSNGTTPSVVQARVMPTTLDTVSPTTLPFTGGDTAVLALTAALAVAVGAGLTVAGRRDTA